MVSGRKKFGLPRVLHRRNLKKNCSPQFSKEVLRNEPSKRAKAHDFIELHWNLALGKRGTEVDKNKDPIEKVRGENRCLRTASDG